MAEATKNVRTETIVTGVTLELSVDEAQYLHDLLGGRIVGDGLRRTLSSAIYYALDVVVDPSFPSDIEGGVTIN